ncbi:MAG: DUF2189 domain-containing protein [Pseudohongiella sp.]|uniref:DUF2189 domain-containing protein n=1 Tax=Pseudohongiella sp. TaxID=1979412 RepID=UPI0034A09286
MSARTDVSADARGSETPVINIIRPAELSSVLKQGLADFEAKPTHGVFLTLIYALIALFAALIGLGENFLPLLFPLVGGLALIGPLAACGLYELSRRREQGLNYAWYHVFDVARAPSRWGIAAMGCVLAALFVAWLMTAELLYGVFFAEPAPTELASLMQQIFMSPAGWQLLAVGSGIGFIYSVVVYMATVVSLPMMLHHKVGVGRAVMTSLKAVQANWQAMAMWYLLVIGLMLLGALPLFVGLGIVVPVLGHATWHLYRRAVTYRD